MYMHTELCQSVSSFRSLKAFLILLWILECRVDMLMLLRMKGNFPNILARSVYISEEKKKYSHRFIYNY